MSNRRGATKISHYKSHGIMPYPYFKHVSPTINNFHNMDIMHKQQIMQLLPFNPYLNKYHTISILNSYSNHAIIK